MREMTLGNRLLSVARLVRQGAVFADVGTDHAYLPLYLLKNGTVSRAICSDINEGPLENARANARDNGYADKIDFMLTDGAAALTGLGITDMAICGMGGELIAEIIEKAPFIKTDGVRLILQPMTKQEYLRGFLAREGFTVTDEAYASEGKRAYLIIACSYTGKVEGTGTPECLFGKAIYEYAGEEATYLRAKLSSLKKQLAGKAAAKEDTLVLIGYVNYVENLINSLEQKMKENTK